MIVDSRNEPELVLEILKQTAMTCPSILEQSTPSAEVTEIKGDRITYAIYFSTASISSAGEARSQFITQLYKRARPMVVQGSVSGSTVAHDSTDSYPIFLFLENKVLSHLPLLEPLSDAEKTKLNAKVIRHHFQAGEQLLTQGMAVDSAHFIFSGVIQVTREVEDGRVLNGEDTQLIGFVPSP